MSRNQFYVRAQGRVIGPFSLDQLRALRNRGQLRRFHEISEDRRNWLAAASIQELFGAEGAGQDSVVPAEPMGAGGDPRLLSGGPLTAASVAEWYYVDAQGNQQGPVFREQLLSWHLAGVVSDATLVWKPGMAEWAALETVLGIVSGPAPRPPAGPGQARPAAAILSWRRIRIGLTLAVVAVFVAIAGGVLYFLARAAPDAVAGALFGGLAAATGLAAQVVQAVALGFFWAAVSPRSLVKGLGLAAWVLAIANAVLTLVVLLLALGASGMALREAGRVTATSTTGLLGALNLLNGLLVLIEFALLLLFLRAVAAGLQEPGLTQRILYLLLFYCGLAFFSFFLLLTYPAGPAANPPPRLDTHRLAYLAFGIVTLALWLVWLVGYLGVLFQCRGRVRALAA